MKEEELINKIRKLRQIKPSKNWIDLTKRQILWERKMCPPIFFIKPVYAGSLFILILFGLFGFAQNSLPGDLLYPIKKITEKSQVVFVSEEELPKVQLELAQKRVEELNKIAESNQVKKLAPAIKEVQESLSQATKNLVKSKKIDEETVGKIVNLKKGLEKAETSLGTKIGTQENEEISESEILAKETAEYIIKTLENSTLTEKQEEILAQMKELVKEGKYSEALELYLPNQ